MAQIQSGLDTTLATVDPTTKALFVLPKGITTVSYDHDDFTLDSFERVRVSEPNVAFEYLFANGLLAGQWEGTAYGAGTVTQNTTAWTTELNTTTATTTGYWAQTYAHVRYAPGFSTIFRGTFNFNALATGLTMRYGMFTDQGTFPSVTGDGIYLEAVGSTINIVVRSMVSGSGIETRIAQTSWNMDPLNGTGKSVVNLNWTLTQHLVIEYQWLGVGTVRVGFETGGSGVVWAHQFNLVNAISTAYTRTGTLPIRAECFSTGALGVAGKLTLICCAVHHEGIIVNRGWRYFSGNSGTALKTIGLTAGSLYPLISIRAAITNDITKRTTFIPTKATIMVQTAATTSVVMMWALVAIPAPLTSATFATATTSSNVAIDTAAAAATAVTGTIIASGILPNAIGLHTLDFLEQMDNSIRAGQNAAGTLTITGANVVCLAYGPLVTTSGVGAAVAASISWKELS